MEAPISQNLPVRSPEQDLAEALGILERIGATYAMPPRHPRINWLLDVLEAELTVAIDPQLLTAYPIKEGRNGRS